MTDNPDDDDREALRRISAAGSDMSRPMDIDVQIAAPSEEIAVQIAELAETLGYRTEVFLDDDLEESSAAGEPWTCQCSRVMIADHDAIAACQSELDEIARARGGYVDGWSTYGNG